MNSFEQQIHQKKIEEKQEELRKEQKSRFVVSLNNVLRERDGRVVLKAILDLCPIDVEVFCPDAKQTAYLCGRRSVGLEIRQIVKNEIGKDILNKVESEEI